MNAAQLGLDVWGFDRVVLTGVPLSGPYEGYASAWLPLRGDSSRRIRSMSGNTMKMFGQPSAAFVRGV